MNNNVNNQKHFPLTYLVQNDTVTVDKDMHRALNVLAGRFYQLQGYRQGEGFDYSASSHPGERMMFQMALEALYFQQCTGELE